MENIFYLQKTANGTNQITLKSKMLEKRIIFLDGEINSESVNKTITQMSLLCAEDSSKPITLLINSNGGSIRDGLVLIDVMRAMPFPIRTVSMGIAASMAAVILAAGTKGRRYITPSSYAMLHQPLISSGLPAGSCSEVEQIAKSLLDRRDQLNTLLSELTGKDISVISEVTSKDTYLSAEEAKSLGLVDVIANGTTLFKLIKGDVN